MNIKKIAIFSLLVTASFKLLPINVSDLTDAQRIALITVVTLCKTHKKDLISLKKSIDDLFETVIQLSNKIAHKEDNKGSDLKANLKKAIEDVTTEINQIKEQLTIKKATLEQTIPAKTEKTKNAALLAMKKFLDNVHPEILEKNINKIEQDVKTLAETLG